MTPRSQFASICFIGKRDRDQRLAEELTSAGYEVCTFANSVDVVVQLAGNKKYSLILVSSEDEADLKFLPKICAAVKIPVIFLTHRGQWEILTAPELPFPWMEVIAFQNLNPGSCRGEFRPCFCAARRPGFAQSQATSPGAAIDSSMARALSCLTKGERFAFRNDNFFLL